ncbi:3-oxoacyl-[acyl-carrier-protein] synthase [Sulfurimonas gotlandica GD1]|uniref:3-oxoacyl-[acyl-carrier-protein] synthase n=1 Tax=Sulfurimonas gotlandica (strain DSM 19862 / JCM 16533 / GD1) TaxID=929558 RepID=B6BHB2_SULGG|nr:beta-ketoacyl synthase N-terminal-like domain-containing protein [Sulfurimonas gotlandica]EDZ63411.1 3-oxoacyl-(acyl-carrier-protein) synthase II [Sulfurimonas gotlandica GD1]EHP29904.1 3-oxoacyl-[acyl-carrier-protein] synthase [Sulfurimonas gotlandica GD1]
MSSVGISKYVIKSSQGNLQQTLNSIKNENIKISSKNIPAVMETITAPYFLFEDEVKDNQHSIYAELKELVSQLVCELDETQRKSTAIIIGTSIIDWYLVDAIEATLYSEPKKEYNSKKNSIDSYAKELSKEFGLNNFTMTINTACTSSANALLEASNLINASLFENVIVLGIEVFSQIMSRGFNAMQLLSQENQKPFDKECDGMVLGEGFAGVLLSKKDTLWSLEGGANCSNSLNITAASQSGDEFAEVMNLALKNTQLRAEDILALKTHGTSTNSNDLAEINAIAKVYDKEIVFTSLKPYVGHTLGACGVLELSLFMACIDDGFIPKTLSCTNPIMENYIPINAHQQCNSGIFMCNYFGFGGNNTSLIIKKESL